jgi:hypothetical protein
MTNGFNLLLEQYNLANYDCDGDFDDYYWLVSEYICNSILTTGTIHRYEFLDAMTDILEIDEDDINVDQVDSIMDEFFDIVKG